MELIGGAEADAAEVQVVSPEVTAFRLKWVSIQVLSQKLVAESRDRAHDVHLLNLVAGCFARLEHTPIRMLGTFCRGHYELSSEEEWHALGDRFAPKEFWRGVMSSSIRDGTPGMRTLVIEGNRPGSSANWIRVKIEPSLQMSPGKYGIFIELHEEHGVKEPDHETTSLLIRRLQGEWEPFLRTADEISEKILSSGGA
jgi:hypothetical protein